MLPRVRGWCRGSVAGANAVGAVFGVGQDVIKMCGESAEKLSERRELTVPVVLSICSGISARVCLRPARRPLKDAARSIVGVSRRVIQCPIPALPPTLHSHMPGSSC